MKVTKWSINPGELPVSEQSEQTHGEPKTAAAALEAGMIDSPAIAPDHEAPKADAPKVETPKVEAAKSEAPKVEASKASAPAPGTAGKMLIMAPGDHSWRGENGAKAEAGQAPARRRFAAMAAVVALAAIAGAAGGALTTMSVMQTADAAVTAPASAALEAAIARIDADMLALKSGLDHTSKTAVIQFNKTSDRLDKIEKAQAEPNAKLAKLSEAVEKLHAMPAPAPVVAAAAPVAAAPVAPKEVTGSVVTPPAVATAVPAPAAPAAAAPATPPKPEVARLPTVDGWYLADVGYGGALIRNRRGTFEVYAGDRIPGLGRIDAIRKQDGHWVVVTDKGLVVAR
jgi:hypothetical protein